MSEISWAEQHRLASGWAITSLEQYYQHLKRLHKDEQAQELREYIENVKYDQYR